MSRRLARTVVHKGRIYAAGTSVDAAKGVPDGPWWDAPTQAAPEPEEPPRGGAGSGEAVWRAYAKKLGITVGEDDSRDDIIDAVDAARS